MLNKSDYKVLRGTTFNWVRIGLVIWDSLHASQHLFREKKLKCFVTVHWVWKRQVQRSSLKVNFCKLTWASLLTFSNLHRRASLRIRQTTSGNSKHGINPFHPFWCTRSMHKPRLGPYWCWKWSTDILRDKQADPQTRWKSNDLCGRTVAATHKCTKRQMDRQVDCHTQRQGERQIDRDRPQRRQNQQYN